MSEEIESVDTSTIEDLQGLREQVEVLQTRLDTMEERRDSVSEEVYTRVAADYQGQLDQLVEEAAPLKARAREEYARLREIYEGLEAAQSDARLAKEEIDFRNELGEFEGKEYEKLLEEHQERLATCEQELASAGVVRQSFIDAFGSEEDLEAEPESTEEVVQIAEGEVEAEASEQSEDEDPDSNDDLAADGVAAEEVESLEVAEVIEEEEGDPAGTLAIPEGGGEPSDGDSAGTEDAVDPEEASLDTEVVAAEDNGQSADSASDESVPATEEGEDDDWSTASTNVFSTPLVPDAPEQPPFTPAAGEAPPEMQTDATRIIPKPRLVSLEGGEPVSTFVLGPTVVTLGRATDNSIRLTEEAVSRHHAEVIPGPDGFLLRDMGSENGSYINGKRKKEHLLTEGDIIQIGVRKLRFHDG